MKHEGILDMDKSVRATLCNYLTHKYHCHNHFDGVLTSNGVNSVSVSMFTCTVKSSYG